MLITKIVITKWHNTNKKWYESKGYIYTKWLGEFEVKVEDLPNGSHARISVQCDGCGEILENKTWQEYKKHVHNDGKYYCKKCYLILFGGEKTRKARLKNSILFYDWCYQNLDRNEADKIIARWNHELNVDKEGNKLSPKDVSFASRGINKKGYWFNCLEHPEHNIEQKSIDSFTSGKGSITCNQCNTISITHPHLLHFLVNKEDAYKYSMGSDKKIPMKCPDCGFEKNLRFPSLRKNGFCCNKCGDGIPYPEKFLFNVFEQLLNNNFQTQLSKTTFKWCNKYKFDFYIPKINGIVETHGIQHYEEVKGWGKLKDTQNNDRLKEYLAINNYINNYIILDCRCSELEWIKNSILKSELPILLNFKEEDINWLKCHEFACNSLVKVVCDLWNSGIKSYFTIAKILRIGENTSSRYLKRGFILGWCDYNPEQKIKNNESVSKVVNHKNEKLLSGKEAKDTLQAVVNIL